MIVWEARLPKRLYCRRCVTGCLFEHICVALFSLSPPIMRSTRKAKKPSSRPPTVRLSCGLIAPISESNARHVGGPPYPSAAEILRDGVSKFTLVKRGNTVSSFQITREHYERKCIHKHGSIEAAEAHRKSVRGDQRASGVSLPCSDLSRQLYHHIRQAKPGPNEDIRIIRLPDHASDWAVRVWIGGFGKHYGCCFDFLQDGQVQNIPDNWKITSEPNARSFCYPVKMLSAGKAYGLVHIQPGEEKFFGMQGTSYRIDFAGGASHPVWFHTPQFTVAPPVVMIIPEVPVSSGSVSV